MLEQKRRVRYAPRPPVNGRWELTTTTERRYRFRTASLRKNSKHNSLAACFDGSFVRAVQRSARLVRDIAVRGWRSAGRFEGTELWLIENHVYNLLNLSNSHITDVFLLAICFSNKKTTEFRAWDNLRKILPVWNCHEIANPSFLASKQLIHSERIKVLLISSLSLSSFVQFKTSNDYFVSGVGERYKGAYKTGGGRERG